MYSFVPKLCSAMQNNAKQLKAMQLKYLGMCGMEIISELMYRCNKKSLLVPRRSSDHYVDAKVGVQDRGHTTDHQDGY